MKRFWQCVLLVLMFLLGILTYIQWRFNQVVQIPLTENYQSKVWSHRGVHQNVSENTIAAFQLAKDQNFKGIELDVFYEKGQGLIVSHNIREEALEEEILLLKEVVNEFEDKFFYWVDFKNLTKEDYSSILNEFNQIFELHPNVRSKIYIESGNGWQLRKLAKENINCIYWVQYSKLPPKKFLKLQYIKTLIGHSKFAGISTHFRYIDDSFKKKFQRLNWYVFTVNGPKHLERLSNFKQVTAILTDLEGKDVFEDEK